MHYHSKNTDCTSSDFPLSIVAGIEMGALNRYTNIWPFGNYYLYIYLFINERKDGRKKEKKSMMSLTFFVYFFLYTFFFSFT